MGIVFRNIKTPSEERVFASDFGAQNQKIITRGRWSGTEFQLTQLLVFPAPHHHHARDSEPEERQGARQRHSIGFRAIDLQASTVEVDGVGAEAELARHPQVERVVADNVSKNIERRVEGPGLRATGQEEDLRIVTAHSGRRRRTWCPALEQLIARTVEVERQREARDGVSRPSGEVELVEETLAMTCRTHRHRVQLHHVTRACALRRRRHLPCTSAVVVFDSAEQNWRGMERC